MPHRSRKRTALLFGATGLVGGSLSQILKDHYSYSSIRVFTRTPMEYKFLNIHIEVIDFDQLEKYAHLIAGDDLFICLGTTIRKAGSVKRMEQIDRDLPVQIARIAFQNGVTRCAVVSSIGAGASSRNYYQRIKGEMENGIREIPFDRTIIARPSILFGRRHEFRFGELIGRLFMRAFGWVLFGPMKKYRGIHADRVAKAMINLLRAADEQVIYESDELQTAGKQ